MLMGRERKMAARPSLARATASAIAVALAGSWPSEVRAEPAVSCGGFAMLGGAQISCSHVAPKQPTQFCTFSWALLTTTNVPQVVQGSFLVPPGTVNLMVYQGASFSSALGNPIVLCQGKKSR
jgi:hypothetical protein